jgi:hypothetical protein
MCVKRQEYDPHLDQFGLPGGYVSRVDNIGGCWIDEDSHMDEGPIYHIGEKPMTLKEWKVFVEKCLQNKPYRMEDEVFDILMSDTFEQCKNTLSRKAGEYARGSRLNNFHKAGQILGQSPEKALLGFMCKHEVSIRDIVDDLDKGVMPTDELLDEKIGDVLNYYVLLKALIVERRGGKP